MIATDATCCLHFPPSARIRPYDERGNLSNSCHFVRSRFFVRRLDPENSLNRLWVKNGKIVLLDGNVDSGLELRDALKRLKDDVKEVGDGIRGIIEERVRSAKGEINTHRTAVVIPLKVRERRKRFRTK